MSKQYNYYFDQIEHDLSHIETSLAHSPAFLEKKNILHSIEHIRKIIAEYYEDSKGEEE